MPNDNDTDALLPPDVPRTTSPPSQNLSDDDTSSTATTTVSDNEIFEDCESDSFPLVELEQLNMVEEATTDNVVAEAMTDNLVEKAVADDQPRSSSDGENLGIDRCHEALLYKSGEIESSSEDSKKTSSTENSVDLGCVTENRIDEEGNFDYVDVDFNTSISDKDMTKLMKKLRLNHYTAVSCEADFTLSKCKGLFERDYLCEIIFNSGGSLSRHYPPRIIVPVVKKSSTPNCESLKSSMDFNTQLYTERVKRSVSSRLRTRFVVPVILFDNKFVCRSGTLAVRKTAVFETARMAEPPKTLNIAACAIERAARYLATSILDASSRGCKATSQLLVPSSMEKLRDVDAQIIRDLKIQYICDLMIEDRKMFKQAIRVSSSEKINKDIYNDCLIEQMPYPGCKLFKLYHDARHKPEGLVFDWNRVSDVIYTLCDLGNQENNLNSISVDLRFNILENFHGNKVKMIYKPDVNIEMLFSDDPCVGFPYINWSNYKEWDLVDLTKNYLKMMLYYLAKGHGGLLVHCISGWDRTPLFISILRASLWADGLIHQSLAYREMAYLILAYDWYLFGHDLPNRLRKKQEIMHFCFKFLPYIISDEFSITRIFQELPPEQRGDRTFPEHVPGRRDSLHFLSVYVMGHYFEHITEKME